MSKYYNPQELFRSNLREIAPTFASQRFEVIPGTNPVKVRVMNDNYNRNTAAARIYDPNNSAWFTQPYGTISDGGNNPTNFSNLSHADLEVMAKSFANMYRKDKVHEHDNPMFNYMDEPNRNPGIRGFVGRLNDHRDYLAQNNRALDMLSELPFCSTGDRSCSRVFSDLIRGNDTTRKNSHGGHLRDRWYPGGWHVATEAITSRLQEPYERYLNSLPHNVQQPINPFQQLQPLTVNQRIQSRHPVNQKKIIQTGGNNTNYNWEKDYNPTVYREYGNRSNTNQLPNTNTILTPNRTSNNPEYNKIFGNNTYIPNVNVNDYPNITSDVIPFVKNQNNKKGYEEALLKVKKLADKNNSRTDVVKQYSQSSGLIPVTEVSRNLNNKDITEPTNSFSLQRNDRIIINPNGTDNTSRQNYSPPDIRDNINLLYNKDNDYHSNINDLLHQIDPANNTNIVNPLPSFGSQQNNAFAPKKVTSINDDDSDDPFSRSDEDNQSNNFYTKKTPQNINDLFNLPKPGIMGTTLSGLQNNKRFTDDFGGQNKIINNRNTQVSNTLGNNPNPMINPPPTNYSPSKTTFSPIDRSIYSNFDSQGIQDILKFFGDKNEVERHDLQDVFTGAYNSQTNPVSQDMFPNNQVLNSGVGSILSNNQSNNDYYFPTQLTNNSQNNYNNINSTTTPITITPFNTNVSSIGNVNTNLTPGIMNAALSGSQDGWQRNYGLDTQGINNNNAMVSDNISRLGNKPNHWYGKGGRKEYTDRYFSNISQYKIPTQKETNEQKAKRESRNRYNF